MKLLRNNKLKLAGMSLFAFFVLLPLNIYAQKHDSNKRTKFTEVILPKGYPDNYTWRTLAVYLPALASNIQVKAFMKNAPFGNGNSDLGSYHYIQCPMGTGECPISWSKVEAPMTVSMPNGTIKVEARFANWVNNNDRTGKLEVTYLLD